MDMEKVNSLKDKGNTAFVDGKYDEAIGLYKEALESIGSVGSENSKIAAVLHSNIAQAYLEKKDYSRAVENATESLDADPLFMKSNLRRAIANTELHNLTDAMNDLRLIFLFEPNNKKVKDFMHRCSDLPKMKLELHDLYAKNYMRQVLKKVGDEFMGKRSKARLVWFQNALLRQSFLSMQSLGIANHFFRETLITFTPNASMTFFGWTQLQFMWLEYSFSSVITVLSGKLLELLYHMLQSGTFLLDISRHHILNDETLLLGKYSEVCLEKENRLAVLTVDMNDLEIMNSYSDGLTRLLYHPGLANFKNKKFPKAKALVSDEKHSITSDFLKLWKKNEWPIESLFFVYGIPNFLEVLLFKEVVSSEVKNLFVAFAEPNCPFDSVDHWYLLKFLEILKRRFPSLSNVTITQKYAFGAFHLSMFQHVISLIIGAYETISTTHEWCSKLKVVVFVEFVADTFEEFEMFDVAYLKEGVEAFEQTYPDMRARLCGPRSYDITWAQSACVPAVIEFENDVAHFEFAISSKLC